MITPKSSQYRLRHRLASGVALMALLAFGTADALPVLAPGPSAVSAGGLQPIVATTSTSVRVDLNAPRTIIDWSSFNVAAGERVDFAFDQRNWIVVNRVTSGPININGRIAGAQAASLAAPFPTTPSGNVWFYSPSGVIFGSNARVDVGGMLATSSAPDTTAFLNAANNNIPFAGSGSGGSVTVAGGATFDAPGYIAFVAPVVTTASGSIVRVGDYGSALYGAADSYEIQLFPTFNNDFTIFTFIVPNGAAGTPAALPLNIAGDTQAGTIYLAAYSRAALAGTVINAPGLLVANSSFKEYGQVTITTGRSILLGQVGAGSEAQQVTGVTTGSANVSAVEASGNVNIYLTGTGSLGNFTSPGVHAGEGLLIAANNITIGAGGLVSGDTAFTGVATRSLAIDTAGVVDTPRVQTGGQLTIFRGPAQVGRTTTSSTLRLGTVTSSGNLLINGAGSIDAGAVTAGGEAQLFGALPVRLASLTTGGYTRISSSQSITVGAVRGVDLDLRSVTGVTATSLTGTASVMVGTGGPARITTITGPSLNLDSSFATLGTVTVSGDTRLRVGGLTISGGLTSRNLTLESQAGAFVLGGIDPAGLTNADFQRIRLSGDLNVYAGVTAPTVNVPIPVYGDLEVRTLTLDISRIPRFNLYADKDHEVRIVGHLDTPGAQTGFFRIGDPSAASIWRPKTIKLTDSSVDRVDPDALFGRPDFTPSADTRIVELYATGDILIGSRRFVDLVAGAPPDAVDIAGGLPIGVAPTTDEENRVFLLAAKITMVAGGRILEQSSFARGKELGIILTGAGVPATDPLLTLSGARSTELYVSFVGPSGFISGEQASRSARIVRLAGDTSLGSTRINGCALGVGCASTTQANEFRIEAFQAAPAVPLIIDAPILSPTPAIDEDESDSEAVVTGTGNEEIWRIRK